MNNSLTALTDFSYESFGVRVLGTKLEPWFVAVDVLAALDVHTKNISRILSRLDNDEKLVVNLTTNSEEGMYTTGTPNVWIVSEPGLYKIMLRSRTPKAEAFTRFVTHEVLPSIRKYGYYKVPKPRGRPPKKNPVLTGIEQLKLPYAERFWLFDGHRYPIANGEGLTFSQVRMLCCDLGATPQWAYDKSTQGERIKFINTEMSKRGYNTVDEVLRNSCIDYTRKNG